jgi:hypothetical protein
MKEMILWSLIIINKTDLLAQRKANTIQYIDTESIWDLPWLWVGIMVLVIVSLRIANRLLNKKKFK